MPLLVLVAETTHHPSESGRGMPGEVVSDDHTMVGRALAVIEAVAQCGPNATLAEIAAATSIPKSTVLRIAASLAARNLLRRTDLGYALGPALSRLGEKSSLQREFERYVPVLEELHAAHGGVAWLTAGRELTKVEPVVQVCDAELAVAAKYGWPTPGTAGMLSHTAGGHLVLGQQPELLDRIARNGMPPPFTPKGLREVGQLHASVQRARRDGVAVESEQCTPGWSCVAALLPSTTDKRAMIGVTLPVGRANARELIRSVLRAFDVIIADNGPLNRHS
jgi:DNA-binding IclR family transcriptional regulator